MSAITMIVPFLFLYCVYIVCAQKLGCFWSKSFGTKLYPDRSLIKSHTILHANVTVECIDKCYSQYYVFAGLHRQECYCTSSFDNHDLFEDSLCFSCATNSTYSADLCHHDRAIVIYTTGRKKVPSPPRNVQVTRASMDTLVITWLPPDIPNGNITFYTVRATAVKTFASSMLSLMESEIQGSASNTTILQGLQPGTKYNITITASNEQGSSDVAYIESWTLIGPPDKPTTPKILERRNSSVIVALTEGHSENGPVTEYQVVVVQAGTIPPTEPDVEYVHYQTALEQGLNYYVTAQFDPLDLKTHKVFTVGDGKIYGNYYNAPLKNYFTSAQIGLVVISRIQSDIQRSYSNLTSNAYARTTGATRTDTTIVVLCVAITLFSVLLVASILLYFILRRRHERFNIMLRKLPEQQELTLQGPVHEVDNMAYIPEDMPERVNYYQELKKKVWTIPRNALSIDNFTVRRGRFGTVHTGTVTKDDESCLVTIHIIADGSLKGSNKRHMLRELDVCIRAGSMKYLAGLVGTCETSDTLFVVIEMPLQILKSRLLGARSGDTFPMDRILFISSSVAAALRHLANHKIIHTQLCARSVGLTADWTPKLMGHGIAKYALEDVKYARWTAIECFDNQKKNQSGVIWTFGVLLWEIFSMGGTPYSNLTLDSEVEDAVTRGVRLPQLMDMPDPIYEVMSSCWRNDPEERPTFDELARLDTLSICPITAITEPYLPELELN